MMFFHPLTNSQFTAPPTACWCGGRCWPSRGTCLLDLDARAPLGATPRIHHHGACGCWSAKRIPAKPKASPASYKTETEWGIVGLIGPLGTVASQSREKNGHGAHCVLLPR